LCESLERFEKPSEKSHTWAPADFVEYLVKHLLLLEPLAPRRLEVAWSSQSVCGSSKKFVIANQR
jgi:hypothetical protein